MGWGSPGRISHGFLSGFTVWTKEGPRRWGEPVLASRLSNTLFRPIRVGCGHKVNWERAQRSISPYPSLSETPDPLQVFESVLDPVHIRFRNMDDEDGLRCIFHCGAIDIIDVHSGFAEPLCHLAKDPRLVFQSKD